MKPESQLATTTADSPVLVFAGRDSDARRRSELEERGVEIISKPASGRELLGMFGELGKRSLQSVLVEGGANVAGALLEAGLVNKVSFFIAPRLVGGREAPGAIAGLGSERMTDAIDLEDVEIRQHGADYEITGYPRGRTREGVRG